MACARRWRLWLPSPASARGAELGTPLAPELTGLGTDPHGGHDPVPRAQRFFDQGLRLLYAFNHPEALRAFREAARLDPELAMAYWGQAMALGPNLNAPMTPENGRLAHDGDQHGLAARTRRPRASARWSRRWRRATRPIRAADRKALDTRVRRRRWRRSRRAIPGIPTCRRSTPTRVMNTALGLLAEGRRAEAGDRATRSRRSKRVLARASRSRRRAALLHPRCSRRRTSPSARRRAPIASAR